MAAEKTESIELKRQVAEQIKQEEKRAEAQQAAGQPEAKKADALPSPEKNGGKPPAKAPDTKGKAEEKKKDEGKKPERKFVLERIYVIPLSKAYEKSRSHRNRVAASLVRQFAAKHAKAPVKLVRISPSISSLILSRGARRPPRRLRVTVRKDDKGVVEVGPAK